MERTQQEKNDNLAWQGKLHGTTATSSSGEKYIVSDVYLDANGCTKTGGVGSYNGSLVYNTVYE